MGDEANELCLRLVEESRSRIRADRARASVRVAEMLEVIEQRLLDPDLDVNALLRATGQRDPNVSTRFATDLGLTPWAYILEARMRLAGQMLAESTFQVWRVGVQVGYLTPGSFSRAFKKWSGESPAKFRQIARSAGEARSADLEPPTQPTQPTQGEADRPLPVPAELVSRKEIRRALAGDPSAGDTRTLADRLDAFSDLVRAGYQRLNPLEGGTVVLESAMARNLWQWIEPLPYQVQMRAVESQAPRYRSLVLFNHLCVVSSEARDGVSALKLATLAMASVYALGENVGEDYLNVFARVWTLVAGAHRRLGELENADQHLDKATSILELAGAQAHPVVAAELCFCRAALEIERGDHEEAELLSEEGARLLQLAIDRLLDQLGED